MSSNLIESPASNSAFGAGRRIAQRMILGKLQTSGCHMRLILKVADNCDGGEVSSPRDVAVVATKQKVRGKI